MKFREHHGALNEFSERVIDIESIPALALYLRKRFPWADVTDAAVELRRQSGHDRLGWEDVHCVFLKGMMVGFVEAPHA